MLVLFPGHPPPPKMGVGVDDMGKGTLLSGVDFTFSCMAFYGF